MKKISLMFFALFLFLVYAPRAEPKKQEFIIHKVKNGETLWKIGKMYGCGYKSVKTANNLKGNNIIVEGQLLKVFPKPRKAVASWYGKKFHGRKMANGEKFNMFDAEIAAHKKLPIGTIVQISREAEDGIKKLTIKITDNGPFVKGRDFDLSRAAAEKLGFKKDGVVQIEYLVINTPF